MRPQAIAEWPARRRMPDLERLDPDVRCLVGTVVDRLRGRSDDWADRFLAAVRRHVPGYDVLTDDEVRASARAFLESEVVELEALRIPDPALRVRLEQHAQERVARGMSPETLTRGYQLGSRELLGLMDEIAEDVGLPADLLLAVHDSTWEFAQEAASIIHASAREELAAQRDRLDLDRAVFVQAVLTGAASPERVERDGPAYGFDPAAAYVPMVVRADSASSTGVLRRAIARAVHANPHHLTLGDLGGLTGCLVRAAPDEVPGHLVGVGSPTPLDRMEAAVAQASTALRTAELFGQSGVVRLEELGPRPLVLAEPALAEALIARLFAGFSLDDRATLEVLKTVRAYLDRDQRVHEVARELTVHPNTVRYRIARFHRVTGLDVRRSEDLVLAWWLLHRLGSTPHHPTPETPARARAVPAGSSRR